MRLQYSCSECCCALLSKRARELLMCLDCERDSEGETVPVDSRELEDVVKSLIN